MFVMQKYKTRTLPFRLWPVLVAVALVLGLARCGKPEAEFSIDMDPLYARYCQDQREVLYALGDMQGLDYSGKAMFLGDVTPLWAMYFSVETNKGRTVDAKEGGSCFGLEYFRDDALHVIYEIAVLEGNAVRSDMEGFVPYEPNTFGCSGFYSEALDWAASLGIAVGSAQKGEFYPEYYVTREQFIQYLYRYAKLYGDPVPNGDLSEYADGDEVSEDAREAMAWAAGCGILGDEEKNLYPGTNWLHPQDYVFREDSSLITRRYFANFRGL